MSEVSCEAVRDALLAGRVPAEPELATHVATCEQCSALLADQARIGRALAEEPARGEPDAQLWSSLEADMKVEVGWRDWLRSRPTPLRVGVALAAFLLVSALGLRRLRPDWGAVGKIEILGSLVAFAVAAVFALRLALPVLGRRTPGASKRMLILVAALGVPVLSAFSVGTISPLPVTQAAFMRQAFSCFAYGSLLTAPLVLVVWLLDRGAGLRRRGVYAAAVFGLAANAALTLHCGVTDPAHLLLGHAAIGFVLVGIAGLVSGRERAS